MSLRLARLKRYRSLSVLLGLLGVIFALLVTPAVASAQTTGAVYHPKRKPWPITLRVRTVPRLPGVLFRLDGTGSATLASGAVTFTEQHNLLNHTLAVGERRLSTPARRYRFVGFAQRRTPAAVYAPELGRLSMRTDQVVTAGFATYCPVRPRFVDPAGRQIPPRSIEKVVLRTSTGRRVRLQPTGTSWLECGAPSFRAGTVRSHRVAYAVQSLVVAGTNIVHAGTERFDPQLVSRPTITGYFFSLTVAAHDALFRGGLGGEAILSTPSGTVLRRSFAAGKEISFKDLPAGRYKVKVVSGGSVLSSETVRLSRDETLDAQAITTLDSAVLGGVLALAAVGLPLLVAERRRRLMRALRAVGAKARLAAGLTERSVL